MRTSRRFLLNFGFLILICAGLTGLGVWFWYGSLEESITGMGQIVPENKLRKIMAPTDGLVTKVYAHEDQFVKAGQVLFELDSESSDIQESTVREELNLLKQESTALKAAYEGKDVAISGQFQDAWVDATREASESELKAAKIQIENSKHRYQEALEKQKNLSTVLASREKLLEQYRQLEQEGGIAKKDLLTYEQQVQEQRGELAEAQEAVQARAMELEHSRQVPTNIQATFRKNMLDRLSDHQRRIVELAGEAAKSRINRKRQQIFSPIDGYVNEQAIHGPGEVVSAGMVLASVVPKNSPLIAEVKVTNQDLAYIHLKQKVELRMDAFPYNRFGRLSGTIHSISPSSVVDKDGRPFFLIRVLPERLQMATESGEKYPIKSGMTLSADIITREKNILSFFTEPLHYRFDRAFRDPSNR